MNEVAKKRKKKEPEFTIGREAMEKISAVEGIVFPDEMKRQLDEYDRLGLTHDERERLIVQKYEKKR